MTKKVIFRVNEDIYEIMKKYSDFSGVKIPSIIKQAVIEYLVNLKLLTIRVGKEKYKEMKEKE